MYQRVLWIFGGSLEFLFMEKAKFNRGLPGFILETYPKIRVFTCYFTWFANWFFFFFCSTLPTLWIRIFIAIFVIITFIFIFVCNIRTTIYIVDLSLSLRTLDSVLWCERSCKLMCQLRYLNITDYITIKVLLFSTIIFFAIEQK